jgi:hypothetical protein
MRLSLVPHPDTPCEAVRQISVEAMRLGTKLGLRYRVEGDFEQIALARRGLRERADELWKHTCLEAFVSASTGYSEINLSPSNRWAAYHFDTYRGGMAIHQGIELLNLEDRREAEVYELEAKLDLRDLPPNHDWSVGISAVIELADGRRCFWALRHAAGAPDFHRADTFTCRLPPTEFA